MVKTNCKDSQLPATIDYLHHVISPAILLRPLSALYGLVLKLRHRLYDRGILKSQLGPVPTIVVGNLEFGGTGKTPLTDYILTILEKDFKVGLLSRGYGRETSGYLDITLESTAAEVGDEPLMLSLNHSKVRAAVCEDRVKGLEQMSTRFDLDIVVLDDAFQHRRLRSGFNILVTPHARPFWKNQLVPEGSLRDIKRRAHGAHGVILSKCPESLDTNERNRFREELTWYTTSPMFATSIAYAPLRSLLDDKEKSPKRKEIVLFTGIADDSRIRAHLSKDYEILHVVKYRDHHRYSPADVKKLKEICATFAGRQPSLVTTSKDAVKLKSSALKREWVDSPIFYQPIDIKFIDKGFDEMILGYARANKRDR
jgi:tetraacyldisaccharide 4'-kinase